MKDTVTINTVEGKPLNLGTYNIQMLFKATNEEGLSTTAECDFQVEIVNESPTAALSIDTSRECTERLTDVTLDVSQSNDPNGHEMTYFWYWNDEKQDGSWTEDYHTVKLPVGSHSIAVEACDALDPNMCDMTEWKTVEITDTTVRGISLYLGVIMHKNRRIIIKYLC